MRNQNGGYSYSRSVMRVSVMRADLDASISTEVDAHEVGCPQDPKKKRKKKLATPDRSTSCWRVEILRV